MSYIARPSSRARWAAGLAAALALSTWSHPFTLSAQTSPVPGATTSVVAVNPAITFQTMRGWEVQNEAEAGRPDFQAYRQAAVDKVAEAGINRIRFEIRAGSENPVDNYANWRNAGSPSGTSPGNLTWRAKRYETVNDNDDPNVINPAGFHWTEIDSVADNLVNPLRAKLAAKGESLYVNLNYVSFMSQVTSGAPYVHKVPAEYAEFMLATFLHLQAKYGWVPDGIEVILEPDNSPQAWTGTLIGQVIAATGARLAAAGFKPDFIGPSTMCMNSAVTFFDQAMAVPNAAKYVKELSYHRYCGLTSGLLQTLATKAQAAGIGTSMLEWWDSGLNYHALHDLLKSGRGTSWQQATFVDLTSRDGIGLSYINPAAPTVAEFTNPTKFLALYYQHVRFGAVRVEAASNNSAFDPLAFRNPNGTFAVVVKANSGGAFTVTGLPAGVYGIKYTSQFTNATGTRPNQTITAGQAVTVDMPTSGVITVYGGTAGVVEICGDGIDNDGDGEIDEGCPALIEICGDGIDNDGDGLIDEDCPALVEICGDGIDNDGDGLIDENCVEICGDGIDNDGDGLIDEDCPVLVEICGDGIDNDHDGLIDEDCPALVEICGDGIDNDRDGLIDEDCPALVEICGDGIDNDHDGLIDEDCVEICGDGIDNDGDGLIDEGCATAKAVPGAPRRLSGSVKRANISIKWMAPITGGAVVDYLIEAGVAPGTTLYVTPVGLSRAVSVPGVGTGKYYVRVRARNENGIGPPSNEVVLSVGCTGRPRGATGLTATTSAGLVTLAWSDPDGCSDTTYAVEIAGEGGAKAQVQTFSAADTSATTLLAKGSYYARVQTLTPAGISASEVLKFTVHGDECATPHFQTKLQAAMHDRHVNFTWSPLDPDTASADDLVADVSYVIEVGSVPGAADIGVQPMGRDQGIAADAPPGTYYLRVKPVNVCGAGRPSNEVKVQVQ